MSWLELRKRLSCRTMVQALKSKPHQHSHPSSIHSLAPRALSPKIFNNPINKLSYRLVLRNTTSSGFSRCQCYQSAASRTMVPSSHHSTTQQKTNKSHQSYSHERCPTARDQNAERAAHITPNLNLSLLYSLKAY